MFLPPGIQYILQSTSNLNPESQRRYRDRKSENIRKNYTLDEILHAAMLKLEEEGHHSGKIILKKIHKDPAVCDVIVDMFEEREKQKTPVIKMPTETALAFLLHQVGKKIHSRFIRNYL